MASGQGSFTCGASALSLAGKPNGIEDIVTIDYGAGVEDRTKLQGVQTNLLHLNMHPVCVFDETQGCDLNAHLMARNHQTSVNVDSSFIFF